jgi:hypothetical protein
MSSRTTSGDVAYIRDFHAMVLHQLGCDHQRFSFNDQGVTGVLSDRVVRKLLA